jgi:hypothetical protein
MAELNVKNGSHVDKAFKVKGGHHVVPAGKADTVRDARELTEEQIDALARDSVKVTVVADGEKTPDAGDQPKNATEVLAMANDPAVQFMSFKSAAAKLLGDKTPSKKDEIISALEELATQP